LTARGGGGRGGGDHPHVPIRCPSCGASETVRRTGYSAPLRILRAREWYYCTRCGWESEVEEYKRLVVGV